MSNSLTRVGVFYDGNYFLHVSNYYNYDHPQRRRLSIAGLHRFVESSVAHREGVPAERVRIVDAHYFRGRLNAQEAQQRGPVLYYDRVFDDILMSSGVTTHYSPLRSRDGRRHEKGIDVWFALEAYETALLRKLDVVVLIASDSDYVPLVRKLNSLGCRVMVLGWDFEFTTDNGSTMVTRTSQDLLEEASYPLQMDYLIDNPRPGEEDQVEDLFVPVSEKKRREAEPASDVQYEEPTVGTVGDALEAEIFSLKSGYGFIEYPPNNLFFHHTTLRNADFSELRVGDRVEFTLAHNDRGQLVAVDVDLIDNEDEE